MPVRGKGFSRLTPVKEALKAVLDGAETLKSEEVDLENALGRVLAQDVLSPIDLPPFDRAAMDGYAVRGEDTFGASQTNPIYFRIIGEVTTGEQFSGEVKEYEAVKITTGAPLPKGANAVVMLEFTSELNGEVEVFKPTPPGKNVSRRGEDVKKGDVVLNRGEKLSPREIALCAALGIKKLKVIKRPRVAILSTGDELLEPGEEHKPDKIYDANSFSLYALCKEENAITNRIGILPDDYNKIKSKIESLMGYDVVLISGATSVGKKDLIPEIVAELGEIVFHGVAMRPGEPTGYGRIGSAHVFMLPGFPVATIVAFETFVRPLLQKLSGTSPKSPYPKIKAVLKRKIASELGRRDFVRVKVFKSEEGYIAEPLRTSGSGIISSLTRAQGFVIVPENTEGVEQGEEVEVNLFREP